MAKETMDAHNLQAAWSEYCAEPEPGLATQLRALESEVATNQAVLARACQADKAGQLYYDLMASFNCVGCHFHCPKTGKWKWRGYLSVDNCIAVQVCIGTLKLSGQSAAHDGQQPGFVLGRLAHQNSCKAAAKLMKQCLKSFVLSDDEVRMIDTM